MGTRGAYGFRINQTDKATYNHFDSYPDGLGRDILNYIVQTPLEDMVEAASRILLVHPDMPPTLDLIDAYSKYADLNVSRHTHEDWYCLLRKTQGDLSCYHDNLKHMIDSQSFLTDSLFCEWAYIINLDSGHFEAYTGFNKDPTAPGRYSGRTTRDDSGYCGVALALETPLSDIKDGSINELVERIERLGNLIVAVD